MATKNTAFKAFSSEGSSWADDDDELDIQPLIIAPTLPEVVEKEQPEEEAPARRDYHHDKHADDRGRGPRQDHHHYDDRRGGHHDDRRGGGHHDSYRNQRSGGSRDGGDHVERQKNPVPDRGPFKLFVGNLPFQMNEDDVADFIGDTPTIVDIHFPVDFHTNRPKGFAYVEFSTREALVKALELDGENCRGRAIKIDVASERRQDRSGGFFDKRESRPSRSHDREERAAPPAPKERPHFALLPRTTASAEASDGAKKASIFGDAKPRDESAYLERQKAKELERKKEKEAARKKEQERKKEKELVRKASVDEEKPKDESEKKHGPPSSRKNSHDDSHGFRAHGSGGRGSTRGGRGDRPARADGRGRGGEHGSRGGHAGRGGEHSGRGGHGGRGGREHAAPAGKKDVEAASAAAAPAAPASRKSEPRAKRTEPVKTKIAPPAPAKIVNTFSLLGDDSDSD